MVNSTIVQIQNSPKEQYQNCGFVSWEGHKSTLSKLVFDGNVEVAEPSVCTFSYRVVKRCTLTCKCKL